MRFDDQPAVLSATFGRIVVGDGLGLALPGCAESALGNAARHQVGHDRLRDARTSSGFRHPRPRYRCGPRSRSRAPHVRPAPRESPRGRGLIRGAGRRCPNRRGCHKVIRKILEHLEKRKADSRAPPQPEPRFFADIPSVPSPWHLKAYLCLHAQTPPRQLPKTVLPCPVHFCYRHQYAISCHLHYQARKKAADRRPTGYEFSYPFLSFS